MKKTNKIDKILIPKEKLRQGFKKCREHILSLLSDSKSLYDSDRYLSSIGLSILANEEVGKLNLIRAHIVQNSDIVESEWNEMSKFGSHSFKLTSFYQHSLEDVMKLGKDQYDKTVEEERKRGNKIKFRKFSEVVKHQQILKNRLKKFNEIKKACFYVDWKNSDWFSASSFYSKHELNLIANFLLDFTGYQFFSEILSYKYPSNFFYQVPKEINVMMNDPLWQQREEYAARVFDEDYQKFLSAINYLVDKFPEIKK